MVMSMTLKVQSNAAYFNMIYCILVSNTRRAFKNVDGRNIATKRKIGIQALQ